MKQGQLPSPMAVLSLSSCPGAAAGLLSLLLCSQVPHAQREERQKADVIFEIILCDEISNISQQGDCFLVSHGSGQAHPEPVPAAVNAQGAHISSTLALGNASGYRGPGLSRVSQVRLNKFKTWLICSSKGQ